MRLGVVTQAPLNQLPEELLTHLVTHSPDVFYKKCRPYTKLSIPPSYIENQALCKQFGISPHSILCMEPALWRQQIVEQVVFDLFNSMVRIDFINGSSSLYSFKESEQILDHIKPLKSGSPPSSREPSVCEKITTRLISHLRSLHSLHQRGTEFVADLNQLCQLPSQQLAMLKTKLRPHPLTPTPFQVDLDAKRARQKIAIPVLIKKKPARRRRSSSLGTPRPRHQIKSNPALESQPSHPTLAQLNITFNLPEEDLYQCILHLTRYRSTLVDFFQSVVLAMLRTELPELYSLWVLQSQIKSLQDNFTRCATELTDILSENHTLSLFERLHPSEQQSGSLDELKLWCEAADALASSLHVHFNSEPMEQDTSSLSRRFHSETPELMSSANTSFNEPSSQTGDQVGVSSHFSSSENSLHHLKPVICSSSAHESIGKADESILQAIPSTPPWHGLPSSISNTEHGAPINPTSYAKHSNQELKSLRSSPLNGICRSHQPNFSIQSIFHVPLLLLEQDLQESIECESQKRRAVELAITLAEARLEIEALEEKFRILKLLEEERCSKEEFSGISRLSDIITTARLSVGTEGIEGDINRHVRIKAAFQQAQKTGAQFINSCNPDHRPPSKASESRRQRAIKRRAWLATSRRIDRPWISNHGQADQITMNPINPVWPEPIFITKYNNQPKNLKRKRVQDFDNINNLNQGHQFIESNNNTNNSSFINLNNSTPPDHYIFPPTRLTTSDSNFRPTSSSSSIPTTLTTSSTSNPSIKSSKSIGDLREMLLHL